ncbi:MAG: M1 family metallopeptidase [Alphaproteobacteria bacterium]
MRFLLVLIGGLLWLPAPATAVISGLHHRLDIRLDPEKRSIEATDEIRIDGGGKTLLRLAPNFVITALRVDGQARRTNRSGASLSIDLGDDGRHTISIAYRGRLADATGYLGPGTGWYPDIDGTEFSYEISVQVPNPEIAIAPGRMIEEIRDEETYTVRLASERLTTGIVLMTGPYQIDEKQYGKIRIRTYFIDDLTAFSQDYLDSTAAYLSRYRKRIGDYPFSAFRIVSGKLPVGLGFAGLTYIGERVLRLPFIRTTSLGHEVLHSWWGNGVKADAATGNWAEGLTTYMADYAYAEDRGPDEARKMRVEWLRDYAALPASRERPVRDFISRGHDAEQVVGYNKVAFIFHMLKNDIGEDAFDQGLRRFWHQYKFKSAGWSDLRRAFEATSKRDLSTFFKQWIDRTGAAELSLHGALTTPDGIAFSIEQSGSPYEIDLPVTLTTDGGGQKHRVRITGVRTPVALNSEQTVRELAIDPDFDIFRRLSPGEAPPILRDVTFAIDTVTVLASDDDAVRRTAVELAARLLGRRPDLNGDGASTLLVIGLTERVRTILKTQNLPPTPASIARRGTARAWAASWKDAAGRERPLLVVEADDLTALELLLRPLPHYGRKGYLVFEGSKVIVEGQWPTRPGPLNVDFRR